MDGVKSARISKKTLRDSRMVIPVDRTHACGEMEGDNIVEAVP